VPPAEAGSTRKRRRNAALKRGSTARWRDYTISEEAEAQQKGGRCRPPHAAIAFSNDVIDVRRLRCGHHHRHRRSAIRRHHHPRTSALRLPRRRPRRDTLLHRRRPSSSERSVAPSRPALRYGRCTPEPIHSCGPRRWRLTDTIRGCFLRCSHWLGQPIHIAKKASTPALRDTRIQQAAFAPKPCPAPCWAPTYSEPHDLQAPTDAQAPTAAPLRRPDDSAAGKSAVDAPRADCWASSAPSNKPMACAAAWLRACARSCPLAPAAS
jgi:hypothetical protein